MQLWLNFWTFFFWLSIFGFLFNPTNFLSLLFYSEITWVVLYCYSIITGAVNDEITLATNTFFLLGLAGVEFAFGFLLLILFKNFNVSLNLIEKDKMWNQTLYTSKNSLYLSRYFWNK